MSNTDRVLALTEEQIAEQPANDGITITEELWLECFDTAADILGIEYETKSVGSTPEYRPHLSVGYTEEQEHDAWNALVNLAAGLAEALEGARS